MNTANKAELLAPAGSMESLWAAINNGADAVYLGASAFGARSAAGFDAQALNEAVRIAHFFRRRVYVTVNTLVKEREWQQLTGVLDAVAVSGADAVLVQDMGVLRYIRQNHPDLPVHGSTQMSLHSAMGARAAQRIGIDRVVLAREASLETIRQTAQTGIETEVFVHGALCVSMSGQCAFSAMVGGRSGNRGRCAQPCRLEYRYRGAQGAWLSPRDTCMVDDLPALLNAGVCSLKIEGRLKRPEYVAVVVRQYREALDRASLGKAANAKAKQALEQIFSRGGFSCGYAFGAEDAAIIDPLHVSHKGIPIGKVLRVRPMMDKYLATIRLTLALNDQDGLEIRGVSSSGAIYSGRDRLPGDTVDIRLHTPCAAGDIVYRMDDARQLQAARRTLPSSAAPRVDISARLDLPVGRPAVLTLSDGETEAACEGAIVQPAGNAPLSHETVERALRKTGDLPVCIGTVDVLQSAPAFLASSQLNQLRRDALQRFIEVRSLRCTRPYPVHPYQSGHRQAASTAFSPSITVQCADIAMGHRLKEAGAHRFFFAPVEYDAANLEKLLPLLSKEDAVVLPRQMSDKSLRTAHRLIEQMQLGVVLNNLGQTALNWPQAVFAGEGLYVWNAESLRFMREQGFSACTLPRELTATELSDLPADILPLIMPVYGRYPLMVLNHCPERTYRGLTSGHRHCVLCAQDQGTRGQKLTDRRGVAFPLYPVHLAEGCINYLLDAKPLHLSHRAPQSYSWLLNFTDETPDVCLSLTRHYTALFEGRLPEAVDMPLFVGRYDAGVE